jgi:RNA polymerase sigma-70 factor (ECF subfamily)
MVGGMCEFSSPVADEVLAARANGGCRDCFARLYERYRMALARYLHESFVYDFDTALDIEAEAWKRAFQHLDTYRGERPFKAWLLAITRNLALNHVRHLHRAPDPEILVRALEPASGPLDELERRESLEACVRLVRALPAELREPFVLRTIFDLDVRSVAELLGISASTARGRLFRARKALVDAVREPQP